MVLSYYSLLSFIAYMCVCVRASFKTVHVLYNCTFVSNIFKYVYVMKALSSFEYVEPSGKDMGINVRKKVENIVALLNNKDKIQEVRDKASATRDK